MSEQGEKTQRDLTKATKTSTINTRLLWTGIRTTNKKLEAHTKEIVKNTKELKIFSNVQTSLNMKMLVAINTISVGFELFITQLKNSLYHIAKIMAESFFGLVNSMQILDRTLKDNADMILRALGSEEHWATKEEILTAELIDSLNAFKVDTDAWVDFLADPKWGKDFWEVVQEDAQDIFDQMRNWATKSIGDTFEKQIGFIADKSQEFGKLKIEFFEDLLDVGELMKFAYKFMGENLIKETNEIIQHLGAKEGEDDGIGAEAQKGMATATKMAKSFGLRMVLKGFEALKALIKQIIDVAKSPFTEMFGDTLGGLIKILNTVLKPLKPFFFLLELITTVISAALTPLTVHLWEELSVVFDDLVGMIPELMEDVIDWIEEDDNLAETIQNIINGVMGLVNAFVSGDLFKKFYDLSVGLLTLAGSLVVTGDDGVTLIERFIELALAITNLAISLIPLLNVIEWIVGATAEVVKWASGIAGWWHDIWSGVGPPHAFQAFGEGGEVSYTGPIFAHAGETVHKKGSDDEMIRLLEEMIYLQNRILKMKEEKYR